MERPGPKNFQTLPLQNVHVWDVTRNGERILKKPAALDQVFRYIGVKNYIVNSFNERHIDDLPLDESLQHNIETARAFVKGELGKEPAAPVSYQHKSDLNLASYLPDEDAISLMTPEQPDASDYMRHVRETSLLIHEMAHASANTRRMVILSDIETNDKPSSHSIEWTLGMHTLKLYKGEASPLVLSTFFEEAFAETVATRWREAVIPGLKDNSDMFMTSWGEELPAKYHSPDHDLTESRLSTITMSSYPAIAAYGIELLSRRCGVDLYELMKQARQPETEATAKRRFVQVINSIQPGLYKSLRDLKYDQSTGGFEKGLHLIQDAVAQYRTDGIAKNPETNPAA